MLIEFCLPVYNEEKILEANALILLNYLKEKRLDYDWRIVIVVNGSSDNSEKIAQELFSKYPQNIKSFILKIPGKGQALKKYLLLSKADFFCYMDIDLAASLDDIEKLISPLIAKKAHLTIGSRIMPGSEIKRSFIRELSSQGYNFLTRLILGHKFSDSQCGFKAIERNSFLRVSKFLKDSNWFFDTELIFWINKNNYLVKEIPVNWSENRYNERKSKVKMFRDSFRFFVNLIKLKIRYNKALKSGLTKDN